MQNSEQLSEHVRLDLGLRLRSKLEGLSELDDCLETEEIENSLSELLAEWVNETALEWGVFLECEAPEEGTGEGMPGGEGSGEGSGPGIPTSPETGTMGGMGGTGTGGGGSGWKGIVREVL